MAGACVGACACAGAGAGAGAERSLFVLVLLAAAPAAAVAAGANASGGGGGGGDSGAGASSPSERWLSLLQEFARHSRGGAGGAEAGAHAASLHLHLQPFTIDLPVGVGEWGEGGGAGGAGGGRGGDGGGGSSVTLPLLVLPVPVAVAGPGHGAGGRSGADSDCGRRGDERIRDIDSADELDTSAAEAAWRGGFPRWLSVAGGKGFTQHRPPVSGVTDDDSESGFQGRPAISGGEEPRPFTATERGSPRPRPEPLFDDSPNLLPATDLKVTSQQLVEQFRAQAPTAPHLPPAVLGEGPAGAAGAAGAEGAAGALGEGPTTELEAAGAPSEAEADAAVAAVAARYLPPPAPRDAASAAPPRPSFARSMRLRAQLIVPRSDYTEPYTVWWDASNGASRVEFHDRGQGTVCYRMPLSNGRMQRVEVRTDRTGERAVVACGVARAESAAPGDRAHPALPDIQLFSFAGYTEEEGVNAELWRYELQGAEGELGAARGERLTYRHELALTRDAQDVATPLRYTVTADSSALGALCDAYEHRYLRVAYQHHDAGIFDVDVERQCERREALDARRGEHMARLEPLREFTLPHRDPRHDEGLLLFKRKFERNYADDVEEALRKNLVVQHTRFVTSCNRQGAPFEAEVNFLADRLDAELDVLLGAAYEGAADRAQRFPYSARQLGERAADLPDEFDWRPRGAVTPVKYQGSCSSCWAFAVVGAVEGALFLRTRALVELSEQCLVDCAHSHGANGCRGTWPSHAYDYVTERGLPARAEYTPYAEKVLQCRDRRVPPVTHISGYVNVTPNSTGALKIAIRKHAPTVVVVDAKPKSFMFYKKGVLRDERCIKGPKKKLNHAVLAVGWGKQRDETHFVLKNTYSAKWGDGGYIRLHGDSNTCGVLTFPSYPRLRAPDVDRLPPGAAAAAAAAAPASSTAGDDATTDDDSQDL